MSSLARKSRTVGSPAQGEHSTMLNDPADLDERSLRREVEALSLHLVNLYGSSLTPDMKTEIDDYAGSTNDRIWWSQRPTVPAGEQCLTACFGCMRASCWLLLCAGWAAIAYYLLMPISRVAMFAFSGVGALFVLAAIVDSLFRQSRFANTYYALSQSHIIIAHSSYGCGCGSQAATIKRISFLELQAQPDAIYVDGYYHLKLYRQYPAAFTSKTAFALTKLARRIGSQMHCDTGPVDGLDLLEPRGFDFVEDNRAVYRLFVLLSRLAMLDNVTPRPDFAVFSDSSELLSTATMQPQTIELQRSTNKKSDSVFNIPPVTNSVPESKQENSRRKQLGDTNLTIATDVSSLFQSSSSAAIEKQVSSATSAIQPTSQYSAKVSPLFDEPSSSASFPASPPASTSASSQSTSWFNRALTSIGLRSNSESLIQNSVEAITSSAPELPSPSVQSKALPPVKTESESEESEPDSPRTLARIEILKRRLKAQQQQQLLQQQESPPPDQKPSDEGNKHEAVVSIQPHASISIPPSASATLTQPDRSISISEPIKASRKQPLTPVVVSKTASSNRYVARVHTAQPQSRAASTSSQPAPLSFLAANSKASSQVHAKTAWSDPSAPVHASAPAELTEPAAAILDESHETNEDEVWSTALERQRDEL